MIYVRMVLYTIATAAAAFGLGDFDPEAGTFTIDIAAMATAIAAAGLFNGGVFKIWGKK